jgi:hypothetical protein
MAVFTEVVHVVEILFAAHQCDLWPGSSLETYLCLELNTRPASCLDNLDRRNHLGRSSCAANAETFPNFSIR